MICYEARSVSKAEPAAVFDAWINVDGWTEVEHVESATIDGEFRVGAVIRSKAKGFPTSLLTVTRVEPPKLWVDESRTMGLGMLFEHKVEALPEGTLLTERVVISGPLARIVGPLLRRKMEALFQASTRAIAAQAESASGH